MAKNKPEVTNDMLLFVIETELENAATGAPINLERAYAALDSVRSVLIDATLRGLAQPLAKYANSENWEYGEGEFIRRVWAGNDSGWETAEAALANETLTQ